MASGPVDAPPVILVHGWSLDSTIWFYAKRDLARRFRVIVWRHRGLGDSRVDSTSAVRVFNMAEDLATVLRHAGNRPAVLVGHAIGSMIIQTWSAIIPRRCGKWLASCCLTPPTPIR